MSDRNVKPNRERIEIFPVSCTPKRKCTGPGIVRHSQRDWPTTGLIASSSGQGSGSHRELLSAFLPARRKRILGAAQDVSEEYVSQRDERMNARSRLGGTAGVQRSILDWRIRRSKEF